MNYDKQHKEDLQRIRGFRLIDDDFMNACFDGNIEIQRADKGAGFKRARYHSSIIDAHTLKPNEDFSKLPETFHVYKPR